MTRMAMKKQMTLTGHLKNMVQLLNLKSYLLKTINLQGYTTLIILRLLMDVLLPFR